LATIADVAKLAGLSHATVSRVINNYPHVSEEKKRLVREAMEQLNYYPNSSAQKLRNQKTNTIAVFVPLLTNPFFANLLEGIDTVAINNGFQLLVCQTRYDKEKELKFLELLTSKQVDGIILTSIENDWEKLKKYTKYGPIVLCNEYDERAKVPSIHLDQVYGGYIGTKHLIKKGHQKIAYCRGKFFSGISKNRELGFRYAMEEFGLPIYEEWIFRNAADFVSGKQTFRNILIMNEQPTAIFTGSDQVAAGIILEAKTNGLRVPEDIAVIGFDDQAICEMTVPRITTIKQPILEIGSRAIKCIIDLILKKDEFTPSNFELEFQLIEREST
jgi:LacI family transcriptional regulator, repressor for deo operon, udp, cdd, tsx, nupC, and nupG